MTDTNDPATSGEQRLAAKRNRFWRYVAIAFMLSALAGFFSGWLVISYQDGTVPLAVPLIVIGIGMAALVWFTRDYFRRVDELDLMDNLWSHLIGLYGTLIFYGAWYFLHDLGITTEPTALGVIIALIFITFAAYGLRKLGWR